MHNHWTQVLDSALCATYIVSKTNDISFEDAIVYISKQVDATSYEKLEEYCWITCFMCPSHIIIPYKPTLREVLEPLLAGHGITWEQYKKMEPDGPDKAWLP